MGEIMDKPESNKNQVLKRTPRPENAMPFIYNEQHSANVLNLTRYFAMSGLDHGDQVIVNTQDQYLLHALDEVAKMAKIKIVRVDVGHLSDTDKRKILSKKTQVVVFDQANEFEKIMNLGLKKIKLGLTSKQQHKLAVERKVKMYNMVQVLPF